VRKSDLLAELTVVLSDSVSPRYFCNKNNNNKKKGKGKEEKEKKKCTDQQYFRLL